MPEHGTKGMGPTAEVGESPQSKQHGSTSTRISDYLKLKVSECLQNYFGFLSLVYSNRNKLLHELIDCF